MRTASAELTPSVAGCKGPSAGSRGPRGAHRGGGAGRTGASGRGHSRPGSQGRSAQEHQSMLAAAVAIVAVVLPAGTHSLSHL